MDRQKNLVLDLDGVLTDGKQYITSDGKKLFKAFHSRDVAAIREFIANGWRVIIVTADSDESGQHFANKVGAEFVVMRDKSQLQVPSFVAVGDAAWDVPLFQKAWLSLCPADAGEVAKQNVSRVLSTRGGAGVMEEVFDIIHKSHRL